MLSTRPRMGLIFTRGSQVTVKTCRGTHRGGHTKRVTFIKISTMTNKIRDITRNGLSTAFVCPAKNSGIVRMTVTVLHNRPCRQRGVLSATLMGHTGTHIVRVRVGRVLALSRGVRLLGRRLSSCFLHCSTRAVFLCTYIMVLVLTKFLFFFLMHTF